MDIKVEGLNKSYFISDKIEVRALHDVELEVKSGETIAIIGPSGAGKSTLLHLIGLMDSPTRGKVMFEGIDQVSADENQRSDTRRNKIGFLFQLHYLLPEFTIEENVMLPVWHSRSGKKDKVKPLLGRLGLSERLSHLPSELSGGEQQRAALARALICEPRLLLCDEPTGNLDRETGENVENIIFSECREKKITLILVTHNMELAKKAGRIIEMRDGAIVTNGAY